MADSAEIMDLLNDVQMSEALNSYTDSQMEYISDLNNGAYGSGQILFDTSSSMLSKWVVLRDSFLQVPIQLTTTGTAYTAATLLSFKQSVLSFITGLTISTSSGQTIVSDNNISIVNNLRLLVESEQEWEVSEGSKLMFAKDRLTTLPSATLAGGVPVNTSTTNAGFLTRIQLLKQQCVAGGTTTWQAVLNIPLRFLHDFFSNCSFPQINNRWSLTFQCAVGNNTTLNPFTTDSAAPVAPPSVSIGGAGILNNGVPLSNCRLYYKSVKFAPSLNQQLLERLNQGYTKKIFYRVTDTYLPIAGVETAQTTGNLSKLVSPSTVRPLRVWLLAPPASGLSTSGSDTVNGSFVFPGGFNNINVLINNTPYYNNSLSTLSELWSVLEEQFPGKGSSTGQGSLISYSDFVSSHRLHCLDVSRLKDRLSDPNSAVSIQIQATRSNSTSCDYYYIVERLQAVTFNYTASETKLIIGL